jgi:hypothetical protein
MDVAKADSMQRNSSYFRNQSVFGDSCGEHIAVLLHLLNAIARFHFINRGPSAAVACTTGTVSKAFQLSRSWQAASTAAAQEGGMPAGLP